MIVANAAGTRGRIVERAGPRFRLEVVSRGRGRPNHSRDDWIESDGLRVRVGECLYFTGRVVGKFRGRRFEAGEFSHGTSVIVAIEALGGGQQ